MTEAEIHQLACTEIESHPKLHAETQSTPLGSLTLPEVAVSCGSRGGSIECSDVFCRIRLTAADDRYHRPSDPVIVRKFPLLNSIAYTLLLSQGLRRHAKDLLLPLTVRI